MIPDTPPETWFAALLLALAIDAAAGDPAWLYRRVPHPVQAIGRAIAWLEAQWLDLDAPLVVQWRRGAAASLVVIATAALAGAALQALCLRIPYGWLLLGLLMSTLLAGRGLYTHVAAVAAGLDADLAAGRRAVAAIVGRDPESLDRHAVARAAIESTAENFVDGVLAPLFWGALLGLPGMLAYKAINTLDSMIGHRSPRHRHFGAFAARLDDAANWLPARLGGPLIVAASLLLPGTTPDRGWRVMWRDASQHRSPNAGWSEAAMAGCLGLRLAGPRRYGGACIKDAWMGDGRAEATPGDIRRALHVLVVACALSALPVAVVLAVLLVL